MAYYNTNKIEDTQIEVVTLTSKRYRELKYIEHDYYELKRLITNLKDSLNALEIFREHDLKEDKIEEI